MRIIFTALIKEEVKKNIVEAVELYMESAKDLGILEEILDDAGIDTKTTKEPIVDLIIGHSP
jgi:hypothetical protein